MNLFTIEDGIVKPIPETLLIYPFDVIWNRDEDPKKHLASKEFAFIEFSCSYKKDNPYVGYPQTIELPNIDLENIEEETVEQEPFFINFRQEKIIKGLFKDYPEWQPDDLIVKALIAYRDFQNEASPSIQFYESALNGVRALQDYYNTLDMRKVTNGGALVNKPADVSRGLSQTAGVLKNLEELKDKVQQELLDAGRVRANRVVNPFER